MVFPPCNAACALLLNPSKFDILEFLVNKYISLFKILLSQNHTKVRQILEMKLRIWELRNNCWSPKFLDSHLKRTKQLQEGSRLIERNQGYTKQASPTGLEQLHPSSPDSLLQPSSFIMDITFFWSKTSSSYVLPLKLREPWLIKQYDISRSLWKVQSEESSFWGREVERS